MFDDKRSKKVIVVAHCILNQDARIDKCGRFPGAMGEVAQALIESDAGILQMPCPELWHLGLDRRRHGGLEIGIREALSEEDGRNACCDLAQRLVYQIKEYQKHGFEIIGMVGIDGSPACGVDITHYWEKGAGPGTGAFIQMLREEFGKNGIDIDIIGVSDLEMEEAVARIKHLLEDAA